MTDPVLIESNAVGGVAPSGSVLAASRPTVQAPSGTSRLTVEHVLYGSILLVAVVVRLVSLGAEPLSPSESAIAWRSWLAATGATVEGAPASSSALLYGLQSLLFWIAGSGDALARLIPAAAGIATVLLPWFWRDWLGRRVALVTAALFAIDPWLMAWSRRADPYALTIFLLLLTLTALWKWSRPDHLAALRWERIGAVSLALLLASGPWVWGSIPVLVLFVFLYVWPAGARRLQRSTFVWFGVTLALAITGLSLRPEAIASVSISLTDWLADIGGAASSNPLSWSFLRLGIDQPLLALLGSVGLILLWVRPATDAQHGRRLPLFLTLWLAWGLLLWLLPGRGPAALPFVGLPLAVAAASLIARGLDWAWGEMTALELFTLLLVQGVLLIAASLWFSALVENVVFNNQVWLTSAIIVVLMLVVWITFGLWSGWNATAKAALLFYATVLLLLTVRAGWQLSHDGTASQPDGFWPAVTSPDTRLLVKDIERLSSIRHGDPNELPVQVVYDLSPAPLLGWQLRNMRNLQFVRTVDRDALQQQALADPARENWPLIVAPSARNESLQLPDPYIGAEYTTALAWTPSMLQHERAPGGDPPDAQQRWMDSIRPQLRWLLYRKTGEPPVTERVTLWASR